MINIYLDSCCYDCSKALLDMDYSEYNSFDMRDGESAFREYTIKCKKSDVCMIRKNAENSNND